MIVRLSTLLGFCDGERLYDGGERNEELRMAQKVNQVKEWRPPPPLLLCSSRRLSISGRKRDEGLSREEKVNRARRKQASCTYWPIQTFFGPINRRMARQISGVAARVTLLALITELPMESLTRTFRY
jgi:hypothetical protein